MLKNIFIFLKKMFGFYNLEGEEKDPRLNKVVTFRMSEKELELAKSYAELRGLTLSEYFRQANTFCIDSFIKNNY